MALTNVESLVSEKSFQAHFDRAKSHESYEGELTADLIIGKSKKYDPVARRQSLSVEKPSLDLTDQSKVMQNRQKYAASQHDVHKAKRLHYAQQQLLDDHAEHRFRQALHRPSSIHGSTPPSAARAGRQLLGQRKRR